MQKKEWAAKVLWEDIGTGKQIETTIYSAYENIFDALTGVGNFCAKYEFKIIKAWVE